VKLVTAAQMRKLDNLATSKYGIPSLLLMENAGKGIAENIEEFFGNIVQNRRILIFSGKGNNGGDGFVVARHLVNRGADVKVFLLAPREEITGDALTNLKILENMNVIINTISDSKDIQRIDISLLYADLVVDAIFGTGFKGKAAGLAAKVIERLNESGKPIFAVDLPSGLEADTGKVNGPCVRAFRTCTLGLPKVGLYLMPGNRYAGEITVVDISLPQPLRESEELHYSLITRDFCKSCFDLRDPEGHKGTYGHVFVVGGSEGMSGAVAMAAEAALKSGAGLVTAAIPRSLNAVMENKLTEVMTVPLPETEERVLGSEAVEVLLKISRKASVIAIGPGLSKHRATTEMIHDLLPNVDVPMVIDADTLNALSQNTSIFSRLKVPVIITPHPGEMARLLGCSTLEVQGDRINTALKAAGSWNVIVVLKGANTIVATPQGQIYVNATGNPGMATGGTGDVLAGMIAGFWAQGMRPAIAAAAGVYIHGLTADRLLERTGYRGMTAGDILREIPATIAQMEGFYNI